MSRLVHDLVESGSERLAGLLEQAGNLTGSLMEAAGALVGGLLGDGDEATATVGQLMGGVGGLLGSMADALFQALGGSGGAAAPSSGMDVPLPAAPPPGAPAAPSGPAPAGFAHPLASSGSVADGIPQFLAVLCAFSFALLQGGRFCLGREPGRLRSNALSLAVERPG